MKVFVTGATGVMGRSAVRALNAAGHDVVGLARDAEKAATLDAMGVSPVRGTVFDQARLAEAFAACDVVCNMATHVPVGLAGIRHGAWKANDRIRSEGSRIVARAAREAGVCRLIQESVSFLYADAGEEWISEGSPIAVTRATEPVVLAETSAEEFGDAGHIAIILRFGAIIGDDGLTRWRLRRVRAGRPIGFGEPEGWTHVVHVDDIGSAVVACLGAPAGTFNVGANPIRRGDLVAAFGAAAGTGQATFLPRFVQRLGGERLEPLMRSQRVNSAALATQAAWKPFHPDFSVDWLSELQVA